ncbi:MAG: thioredoxin family protein [Gemmobacter sp.]
MLATRFRAVALALTAALPATPAVADLQLLMFERPGCTFCMQWDREVGQAYPQSPEGQAAPLLRAWIKDPLPEGITLNRPAAYTPTFVLLKDGQEESRIEGYPGADFFWGLIGRMLKEAGADYTPPEI